MPVKTVAGGRLVHIVLIVVLIAGLLLMAGLLDDVFAQGSPFGTPRSHKPHSAPRARRPARRWVA